ncbi:MAG: enoyl-CoA hydratase/isomerase family protein [Geobacter sp.]|nr:enoyl-CoA hydratase/isomerase family protein [Geobacter sp.]
MSNSNLTLRREGDVAVLALNRPESLNALTPAALLVMKEMIERLRDDAAVKGIVLTGEGKSFCAGADIGEMARMAPMEAARFAEQGQALMFAIERVGKPVIAAVNGHALGGGLELALACDFIVAAESAILAAPEVRYGIIPGFGGTQRLARLVGKAKAKELIFSGDPLTAHEAYAIGLVNRVFPDVALLPEAVGLVDKICSRGTLSLRMAKEIIDAGYDMDLRNACLMERDAFALCFTTEDQKEGMGAFVEKRPARFKGK